MKINYTQRKKPDERVVVLTFFKFVSKTGATSPLVFSTKAPPIILKHFLSLGTLFKVSITIECSSTSPCNCEILFDNCSIVC